MATRVVTESEKHGGRRSRPEEGSHPDPAWILGWIGVGLAVVGGLDFLLTWVPLAFGNVEWEFGTVTASFNGLPVVTMGLGLMMYAGLRSGRRWLWWAAAIPLVVLTLVVVAGLAVYLLTLPMALGSTAQGGVRLGLQKAVVKTVAQGVVYPVIYLGLLTKGWKSLRT